MTKKNTIPYGKPSISKDDIAAVTAILETDTLTRGPTVEAFESEFALSCGAKHAIAFPNGTDALVAAGHVAKLSSYDRVITTPNTFVATVVPALKGGATLTFVDIDRETGNLDCEQVGLNIETPPSRGRHVVIPVHFAGIPLDMRKLDQTIKHPNVVVIEDASHALGSCYPNGSKVGSCEYSLMTTFSFHPVKTITTGEGGMVTTNDDDIALSLKQFRNNGIVREREGWGYQVNEITGNYNVTDIQAALGLSQLKRLDVFVEKRRKLVDRYIELLSKVEGIRFLKSPCHETTSYHLFVVQIADGKRDVVMEALKEKGIGSQVHYIPVYRHPFFVEQYGDISEYFPEMEGYFGEALSLPLYYDLTLGEVDEIVKVLKVALG